MSTFLGMKVLTVNEYVALMGDLKGPIRNQIKPFGFSAMYGSADTVYIPEALYYKAVSAMWGSK